MIDSTNDPFQNAIDDYVVAEVQIQAATARRDAAKRAVMRARPAGVTSVEVTRRLRAAAVEASQLVQVLVTKNYGAPRLITSGHFSLSSVDDPKALVTEATSLMRASDVTSGRS